MLLAVSSHGLLKEARMRRFLLASGMLCSLVCQSFAQTNAPSDATEAIKALAQEVRELRAQVAELQAKQAKLEAALSVQQSKKETERSQTAEALPPQEQAATGAPEQPSFSIPEGIKIQGFGEA